MAKSQSVNLPKDIGIRKIDSTWDYKGEKTKSYTHCMHTYPAMFIPQVARRLLEQYSKKGETICDIFCGSGTALVESRLLGRNSYGIDLNPLATFLAKVKITEIDNKLLYKTYFKLIDDIQFINNNEITTPSFKNIDFWFKPQVIKKLAKLKKVINEIKKEDIRNFFMVIFSETVRLSSNTRSSEFKLYRYAKEKLENYDPDVIGIFKKKAEISLEGMTQFCKDADKNTWAKVIFGDSSKDNGIKENSIDCIITSPPYGDSRTTVAYGQFSRLSLQWLDIVDESDKVIQIDNVLLGGRATINFNHTLKSKHLYSVIEEIKIKDEKRAREVLSFFIDLEKCIKRAYKILKPQKYFCIVIGNRLVKQVRIPTDFIISELGQLNGFSCENLFVRNIPGKRMPIKNSPTNKVGALEDTMTKESIVILKKIK